MSFLTRNLVTRMAFAPRVIAIQTPRTFVTYPALHKTVVDSAKDAAKTVDRAVSDKLVDGINAAEAVGSKVKEGVNEVTSGHTAGKASELRGEAAGKAQELKGEAKGKAQELKGQAKGAAEEVKGKVKGAAEDVKSKI